MALPGWLFLQLKMVGSPVFGANPSYAVTTIASLIGYWVLLLLLLVIIDRVRQPASFLTLGLVLAYSVLFIVGMFFAGAITVL